MRSQQVECLFVVVGAGASLDCATAGWKRNVGDHLTPPLVKDLFSQRYAPILDSYPVAQMVAADLEGSDPEALVLEEHIRARYRDSDDPLDRQKFLSIAPYLQDLLAQVSTSYARAPDNHNRLVSALLRLNQVVFVSLNYDTLLDDQLALTSPLASMDDYIRPRQPNWALIKLHGSINWGRAILSEAFDLKRPSADLEVENEVRFRPGGLDRIREDTDITVGQPYKYFPALSVPVGEVDEVACPPSHVEFLETKLGEAFDGVDLLVIGYSANDQEVLNLVRDVGRPIRSLAVVNRSGEDAQEVAAKLRIELNHLGVPEPLVFGGRYAEFATDAQLTRYVDWLRARPSRAVMA